MKEIVGDHAVVVKHGLGLKAYGSFTQRDMNIIFSFKGK